MNSPKTKVLIRVKGSLIAEIVVGIVTNITNKISDSLDFMVNQSLCINGFLIVSCLIPTGNRIKIRSPLEYNIADYVCTERPQNNCFDAIVQRDELIS